MKRKHNEFVIGLSVTIATLIVIFGILWLGKSNFLVKGLHLKMLVQNANGLTVGDEVFYRGLNVGTVQATGISEEGIVIQLKLEKAPPIPVDSRFIIKEISLLGEKGVEIIPGKARRFLSVGDTVKGETALGMSAILGNGDALQKRIDNILQNVERLSGEQTFASLQNLIRELHQTTVNLNTLVTGSLKETLDNIKEISAKNKRPVHTLLDSLARQTANISGTIRHTRRLSARLDALLEAVGQGEGTLGKVVKNDSLYYNMNRTINRLDSLIEDIKKNPERYFQIKVF